MAVLLVTLLGGVVIVAALNALLVRTTPLPRPAAAAAGAAVALLAYVPVIVVYDPAGEVVALHVAVYGLAAYAIAMLGAPGRAEGARRPWAPFVITGFFVVVIVVDAAFIVVAERGLPGAVSRSLLPEPEGAEGVSYAFPGTAYHDLQEKTGQYNDLLDQLERQRERGWRVDKGWVEPPVAGRDAVLRVTVDTRGGAPVAGAEVTGRLLRYSDDRLDRRVRLDEVAPGDYRATVRLPSPGTWRLVLDVERDGERHHLAAVTRVAAPATSNGGDS